MAYTTFKLQYRKINEKDVLYEVRWENRKSFDLNLKEMDKVGINFNEIEIVKFDYFIDDNKRHNLK